MEEFEEKVDRIAEGEDDGENSWISKIYNQFSFFNDGENSLEENDMDGLEPPLLDETWGLGVRTAGKGEDTFVHLYKILGPQRTMQQIVFFSISMFHVAGIEVNQATCAQSFYLLGTR